MPRSTSCDVLLSYSSEDSSKDFVLHLSKWILSSYMNYSSWDWNPRGPLEDYKAYVVVFSKTYASSTRYLQQLAAILAECIYSPAAHIFLPILFDLDPSEVRNRCFLQRMQGFGLNPEKVATLMTQCPDLVVRHPRDLRRVVDRIIKEELNILCPSNSWASSKSLRFIDSKVKKIDKSGQIASIGIRYHRVENFVKLLDLDSKDVVRVVGICGMGGIGKTALARDVFNKISHLFDSSCFLTHVSQHDSLLSDILLRLALQEEYVYGVYNIDSRLRHLKMLIVFDDADEVDNLVHLRHLTRNRIWLGGGSRIVIVSRDEHVLEILGVDEIHKVELLNKNEALRLFCKIAFKRDYAMSGYEEVVLDAIKYADGLPLAIKSLGSSLRDRSILEWKSELAKLRMVPDSVVLKVLKKSFDGLSWNEKTIFLDIACCFAGQNFNYVKKILSRRGQLLIVFRTYISFDAEPIIRVLIQKSLVNILHEKIEMHSLLQQLGKEIVREESNDLGKHSRIWRYEDFRDIMETNNGSEHIEVIVLLNEEYAQESPLNVEGFSKMDNLRVAIFRNVSFSGSFKFFPRMLTYLSWHKYPFTCLPSSFEADELEQLIMQDSCITQLVREGLKIRMWGLRNLDLRGSKNLKKTPDFERLPRLKMLDLEGCTSLLQLDPTIASLRRLKHLNLRNCTSIVSIPNDLFGKNSIEFLNLAGCSKFAECLSFD